MADVVSNFKTPRVRDRRHIERIKELPCSFPLCRRGQIDPHHLKCGPEGGGSVRASDSYAVPLCRTHHDAAYARSVHSGKDIRGRDCNEAGWWAALNIDPIKLAARLWSETLALRGKK